VVQTIPNRKTRRRALEGAFEVVSAHDGEEALARLSAERTDAVLLDVKLPRLGGLETLERLMAEQPVPVLLMSTLTQEGAEVTLRGLELGAMDFVTSRHAAHEHAEPRGGAVAKIRALGARGRSPAAERRPGAAAQCVVSPPRRADPPPHSRSSTGSRRLPGGGPRRPASRGFTKSLAERLAPSAIPVREAAMGSSRARLVLIAPGSTQLTPGQRVVVASTSRGRAAPPVGRRADGLGGGVRGPRVGVVLTGMGAGPKACGDRREVASPGRGRETCVIYGMPKAAIEAGSFTGPSRQGRREILAAV
jgi:two-component system chemotaxis response regulator CheB